MAKKHKKNKKWLYWLLMVVLFVAAAMIAYLVWNAYFKDEDKGQDSDATPETVEIWEREKSQRQEEAEIIEKPKVVQYDGGDPNDGNELSGVITYAGVNGDYLMIRINIDQYLESGECVLRVLSGGNLIHEEVTGVMIGASTASCDGFDVPVELIGSGMFDIVVDLEADDKSGTIRKEVEI